MRILITLLLILNISTAHSEGSIFFSQMPSHITIDQSIASVKAAALKRRWSIDGEEDNELRIKLDHRGYKARLTFNFTESEIRYFDSTTTYEEEPFGEDPFYDARGDWKVSPAPVKWIANLKKDMNAFLKNNVSRRESLSNEQIEDKLKSLKRMYDNKLITEDEYKLKKKDIISRY